MRVGLWSRYAAGSVIAGVISQGVFVAAYALGAAPAVATVAAFVAGAVPNYVLNRRWAWRRTGRVDAGREFLPYVVIIVTTALAAAAVTSAVDTWVPTVVADRTWQVVLVSAAFLGTYGVMFVLKFLLFDRLVFAARRRDRSSRHQEPTSTRP